MTKRDVVQDTPWPVFTVTVSAASMVALDLSIVDVAFPSVRAPFPGVSTAMLSWALAAYSVVFGGLLVGGGRVADRSPERFAVGGAINPTAREIGAVVGVAVLIAVLGTPSSLEAALGRFKAAWVVAIVAVLASAVVSSLHRRPLVAPEPGVSVVTVEPA